MLEQIESIIRAEIRPRLALHGGDIRILGFREGILRFELLGCCSNCPSATLTTEELIRTTLSEALPQVKDVVLVQHMDESLLAQARAVLNCRTP